MYAVSTALRNAIDAGNPQRILLDFGGTSVFSNEEIAITDGVNFTEMFTTGDDLTIGCCPSTELSFSLLNDTGMFNDFQFGQFTAYLGARIDSGTPTEMTKTFTEDGTTKTYAFAPLGTFVADRPDIVKKKKLAIVANDRMTLFDTPMPDKTTLNITYPITLGNLLSAMCTYLSVTLKSSTFTNSTMSVASEPKQFGNATMREVLGWIAEAACAIARFNRNGQLEIRWYSTVNKTFAETSYSEFTPAWFATDAITGTHIRNGNSNATLDLGTDTNVYIIQDNPFLRQDDSNTRSRGALRDGNPTPEQNINTLLTAAPQYHPYSASLFTDWTLEAGDVVTVTSDSESYTAPIHNLNMTWYGKPKVDISAEGNPKRETQDADARRDYDTENTAYNNSRLIFEAEEQIVLKVSKGNVATQLSVECGNVSVSGGNLTVSGYITSEGLNTTLGSFTGPIVTTAYMAAPSITLNGESLSAHSLVWIGADITMFAGDQNVDLRHYHGLTASVDSNTGVISLQQEAAQATQPQATTFNIADTAFYQQAVSAARMAGYNEGVADATPDSVGCSPVPASSISVSGSYVYGTTNVTTIKDGETMDIYSGVQLNVTAAYNAGVASVPTVNVVKGSWSGGSITFSPSSGSGTSASVSLLGTHGVYDATNKKYTVTIWDGDTSHGTGCQVPVNASGAYAAGWAAARALISTSDNKIYGPPATVDGAAEVVYTITSGVSSGSIYWQSTKTARCDMVGYAYINGDAVRSSSRSQVNSLP